MWSETAALRIRVAREAVAVPVSTSALTRRCAPSRRAARLGKTVGDVLMRLLLVASALLLLLAPAAHGEAVGLRDDVDAEQIAVAGTDVLVARELTNGGVQLDAVPRAGGAPRALLSVPSARLVYPGDALTASASRIVLVVARRGVHGDTIGWEIYSGPTSGPLQVVWQSRDQGAHAWAPFSADVDGDRALILETTVQREGVRAWIMDAGAGRVRLPWVTGSFAPMSIAGDHAAVLARKPRRVAVVDRATGAAQASRRVGLPSGTSMDVAADGRLVTETRNGLLTMRPGAAPQTLPETEGLVRPAFAGTAIAAIDENNTDSHPVLIAGDGSRRVLGGPTGYVTDIAADEHGVAWLANGCVRYAAITGPAPVAPADDPCPSTEIGLYTIDSSRLRNDAVRVRVHCIATPTDACRGTLLLKHGKRVVSSGPFTVPAGARQRVPVRLTRRGLRVARRAGWFLVDAEIPDGRVGPGGRGSSELTVKRR
jgi:hypothetical protein